MAILIFCVEGTPFGEFELTDILIASDAAPGFLELLDDLVGTVIETSGSEDVLGSVSLCAIVMLTEGTCPWAPTVLLVGTVILMSGVGCV